MVQMHVAPRPQDSKTVVERQERLEKILLVPKQVPSQHPLLVIFGRGKNVVNVNNNAFLESRQNV